MKIIKFENRGIEPIGIMREHPKGVEIPEGWMKMHEGEPIPDEYPELKEIFGETFGNPLGDPPRFPRFRPRDLIGDGTSKVHDPDPDSG